MCSSDLPKRLSGLSFDRNRPITQHVNLNTFKKRQSDTKDQESLLIEPVVSEDAPYDDDHLGHSKSLKAEGNHRLERK